MSDPFDNRSPRLMSYDPEKPSLWQLLRDGNLSARLQAAAVGFVVVFGVLSVAH